MHPARPTAFLHFAAAERIMQGLDRATADIRKHLTQKYGLEFDLPQQKLP